MTEKPPDDSYQESDAVFDSAFDEEPPPREVPPSEWSLDRQVTSRRRWVELQGGREANAPEEATDPDEIFGGIGPESDDGDVERKTYRRHFDPPLKSVDPETVPGDEIPEWLEYYREQFVRNGDFIDRCDHLSDRECLRWMVEITEEELDVRGEGTSGVFQLTLECPECVLSLDNRQSEDWLARLESKFESIESTLDRLKEKQNEGTVSVDFPPGSERFRLLSRATFERLRQDLESNEIDVLSGNAPVDKKRDLLDGLRAFSWLTDGLLQFYQGDHRTSRKTLLGGARMVRILNRREPERYPGRLYGDLRTLLPDVSLFVYTIESGEDMDQLSDFPESPGDTPRQWRDLFLEEAIHENPNFAPLIEHDVTPGRLTSAHERWQRQQQYRGVREDKISRLLQDFIGRKTQFEPDSPGAFLDEDVRPVEPEDADPETFSNSALLTYFLGDDAELSNETLDVLHERDEPVESSDVEARRDPIDANPYDVLSLLVRAKQRFHSTDAGAEDVAAINAVYHLLSIANQTLDKTIEYPRDLDHREPVEGAIQFAGELLETCVRITELADVEWDGLEEELRLQVKRKTD